MTLGDNLQVVNGIEGKNEKHENGDDMTLIKRTILMSPNFNSRPSV